jgi:hypothetical protein
MSAFRRVEDRRAGPTAVGILVPPGARTVVILRPRALSWDLLAALGGWPAWPVAFRDFGRDEAAGVARRLQRSLEEGAGFAPCPVEAVAVPGYGFLVCCRGADVVWVACPRRPGRAYEPLLFGTEGEAARAAAETARFLWPPDDAQQEFYFNTQHFSHAG